MIGQKVVAVRELTAYLQYLLSNDGRLANVWVKGEISDLRCPSSGHLYFTLKDKTATLRCVMFQNRSRQLLLNIRDGLEVIARGYVAVYPRGGVYQLYVEEILSAGVGINSLALKELADRLEKEGLFAEDRKRPLPLLPRRVGVITSPHGAALRDIVTVSRRRFPGISLLLAPSSVQGDTAPEELAIALEILNQQEDVDVIIIGRGGGSAEDLSAFNTEVVARAVYASRVPVVTAVGHETDVTLADRVADRRAPTPSAAAEIVVPVREELEKRLALLSSRAKQATEHRLQIAKERLERLVNSRGMTRPQQELYYRQQYLDGLEHRLLVSFKNRVDKLDKTLAFLTARLETVSPLAVLNRGYAVCRRPQGGPPLQFSNEVLPGEKVEVLLRQGCLKCLVEDIEGGELCLKRNG
ncbi:MAG: exodeoxyribonuclease large subunit [Clostridia bacterium]|nr:exodeoxyribonuclease large subunit [Clostridia bacterium]